MNNRGPVSQACPKCVPDTVNGGCVPVSPPLQGGHAGHTPKAGEITSLPCPHTPRKESLSDGLPYQVRATATVV